MARIPLLFAIALFATGSWAQWNPNFQAGRTTMVHLFEWRWNDIAEECERFLGPNGFGGVQTSPANENAVISNRPWWERYQPVSYKLETRSGTEAEFESMVRRCNNVGVRIYVDAVVNHMTGAIGAGYGTGGSYFNSDNKQYDGVPFSNLDFTPRSSCPSASGQIEDYNNVNQVRNCELVGLKDLNGGGSYVREKHLEFLNRMIGYGVAGYRIDAAKHMWPGDITAVLSQLNNLPTSHGFPAGSRPFIFQEVIDLGGEPITGAEYFGNGRVTEFKFSKSIGEAFRGQHALKNLVNFGEGWGMYPSGSALTFVDNHDNQRGHGAGGDSILTYKTSRQYKMATAFKLAWPYSVTRIMSSFDFTNTDQGPPNSNGAINPVPINPDGTCGGGWICEHRWRQIFNMVRFRNVVDGTGMNDWWDNGNNQIGFGRGDKGFIAINNENSLLSHGFWTSLPDGTYCDVISGGVGSGSCTGKTISVASGGFAFIEISNTDPDPVVAIHVGAKLN